MTGVIDNLPPEIVALIDKPWLLAAVVAVGIFIGMVIERAAADWRRYRWRKRNAGRRNNGPRWNGPNAPPPEPLIPAPRSSAPRDPVEQLRIVMSSRFSAQRLLNYSEARVFRDLDRMVLERKPRWQVMAQVALGEILTSDREDAYFCINAKRVDLLVVDEQSQPKHVFEYQGAGHYGKDTAARDAVKKEAVRRAGISYHEVFHETTPAELLQLIERLMGPAPRPTSPS
jgi:hypothetical protein